jgi:hypothetical protein
MSPMEGSGGVIWGCCEKRSLRLSSATAVTETPEKLMCREPSPAMLLVVVSLTPTRLATLILSANNSNMKCLQERSYFCKITIKSSSDVHCQILEALKYFSDQIVAYTHVIIDLG